MLPYSSSNKAYDLSVKILLIGDSGVGKTCLMLQFAEQVFSTTFITTVGIDYKWKLVDVNGKRVRLEIWDTAGQERFKAITTSYLRGAQGILLVYDVTDRRSFMHVDNWISQIKQHAELKADTILVANKCDLDDQRVVSSEEGQMLADQHGMRFFETSAKSNVNVQEGFDTIAGMVVDRLSSHVVEQEAPSPGHKFDPAQAPPSGQGCCQ